MTHLTLVTSSLRRRPLRTIAAILAFTAAVGPCLVGLCAMRKVHELQVAFDRPLVHVRPFLSPKLPLAYASKLLAVPGIKSVEWHSYVRGEDGTGVTHFGIWGVSPHHLDTLPDRSLRVIDPQARVKWDAARSGALVTKDLAARMHWQVDQSVELKTPVGVIPVSIVGLLDGLVTERVVVHYDMLNMAAKLENTVDHLWADCTGSAPDEVAQRVDATFKDSGTRTLSRSARAFASYLFAGSEQLDFLLQETLLLLAVGVVVSAGAIAASIRERKSELATLQAIGYSWIRVCVLILAEAELIAVIGTLIAVLPLVALFHTRGLSLGAEALNNITVSPEQGVLAVVGALALGFASGALPVLLLGRRRSSLDLRET